MVAHEARDLQTYVFLRFARMNFTQDLRGVASTPVFAAKCNLPCSSKAPLVRIGVGAGHARRAEVEFAQAAPSHGGAFWLLPLTAVAVI